MSIIYADTSAVLKRAIPEAETTAVWSAFEQFQHRGDLVISSSLTWLEAWRSLRRRAYADVEAGTSLTMSGVDEFPLDDGVLVAARRIGDNDLRSLDAIHLASAIMAGAHTMMTFDGRLAEAAQAAGITVLEF